MTPGAKYTLARGEQRYGPYTLEELREYVKQGSVQPIDLVWSPGMTIWRPVKDVLEGVGPIDLPQGPPPLPEASPTPKPPSLHWALVLLIGLVTFGLFIIIWAFVQAIWVRKIDPTSKGLRVLAIGLPIQIALGIANEIISNGQGPLETVGNLVGLVTMLVAYFDMRATLETVFKIDLSGIMTFFFNVLYFQYHVRRIARNEHTPRLEGILR